jgi:hypothetical protein
MTFDEAIDYMNTYQCLPLCEHGNHLIDWGRELLAPPCGCSLTQDAPDGAKAAATLSGLYNCGCCGLEKCS